jgi:hypothetical protein
MKFVYDDGGRAAAGFKGHAGDCVARAVAIASGRPYAEVYAACAAIEGTYTKRGKKRAATARNGVHVKRPAFKEYMRSLGFEWTPTMRIGSGCRVHLTDGELPGGRLVVSVSRHWTAVIDGVVRDTSDPQREVHAGDQSAGWQSRALRPGEHRNENGIWTIQRRCVYGYWKAVV